MRSAPFVPGSHDQAAGLRSLMARHAPPLLCVLEPRLPARWHVGASLAAACGGTLGSALYWDEQDPAVASRWDGTQLQLLQGQGSGAPGSLGDLLAGFGGGVQAVLVDALLPQAATRLSPLAQAARERVLVLPCSGDQVQSLQSAYGQLKRLHALDGTRPWRLVVTDAASPAAARAWFDRLAPVAQNYLGQAPLWLGALPEAGRVRRDAAVWRVLLQGLLPH